MESQTRDKDARATLVTGATGFIGSRLTRALVEDGRKTFLLCRPASAHKLQTWLDTLDPGMPRPVLVHGDIQQVDLALAPKDLDLLKAEVEDVFHLAAKYDLGMGETQARAANLGGTCNVLSLAERLKGIQRFHHVSTMAVAGDHQGTFSEDDLDVGQGFDHAYGRSKFEAEQEVRSRSLPYTVYRPGAVVGDSRTGEMDKIDGPYIIFAALHRMKRLPGVTRMPMIVPRGDDSLFHMVPVDFVVDAMVQLASIPASRGRTYHLMDPEPTSYRQFYLAALKAMGFTGPTIARPVQRLIKLLMRPGLWNLTRKAGHRLGFPAEMLPHFLYEVRYDTSLAQADLKPSGIGCPGVMTYLPTLIRYFEEHMA